MRYFSILSLVLFLFSLSPLSVQATDSTPVGRWDEVFDESSMRSSIVETYFSEEEGDCARSDISDSSFEYGDCARSSESAEEGDSPEDHSLFPLPQASSVSAEEKSASEMVTELFKFGLNSSEDSDAQWRDLSSQRFHQDFAEGDSSFEEKSVYEEKCQGISDGERSSSQSRDFFPQYLPGGFEGGSSNSEEDSSLGDENFQAMVDGMNRRELARWRRQF